MEAIYSLDNSMACCFSLFKETNAGEKTGDRRETMLIEQRILIERDMSRRILEEPGYCLAPNNH